MFDINKWIFYPSPKRLGILLILWPFIWEILTSRTIYNEFWDSYFIFVFGYVFGAVYIEIHKIFLRQDDKNKGG